MKCVLEYLPLTEPLYMSITTTIDNDVLNMRRQIQCIDCDKLRTHKAKKLCSPCYEKKRSKVYYKNNKQKKKIYQVKRFYNLSLKEYKKVVGQCYLCGYTRTVDCHHINGKGDNSKLIGLCPNHHRLVHSNKLNKEELNKLSNYGGPKNDNIQML